jgi:hypothetical protein
MVVTITVKTRGMENVQKLAGRLPKAMREEVGNANFNYSMLVRDSLRTQLMRVSERWRHNIWNGIQARKQSKFTSIVVMPQEGVWLDSMRPHWVWLKRGRLITQWAKDRGVKGKFAYFNNAPQRLVFVRPHPFIDAGIRRSRKRLTTELRKGVRKAFRKSRGG